MSWSLFKPFYTQQEFRALRSEQWVATIGLLLFAYVMIWVGVSLVFSIPLVAIAAVLILCIFERPAEVRVAGIEQFLLSNGQYAWLADGVYYSWRRPEILGWAQEQGFTDTYQGSVGSESGAVSFSYDYRPAPFVLRGPVAQYILEEALRNVQSKGADPFRAAGQQAVWHELREQIVQVMAQIGLVISESVTSVELDLIGEHEYSMSAVVRLSRSVPGKTREGITLEHHYTVRYTKAAP